MKLVYLKKDTVVKGQICAVLNLTFEHLYYKLLLDF